MRDTEAKLPRVTQLISGRASNWRLSDPKLLHLAVNSVFLRILFSFRSLLIKCDKFSLKTDNPWNYWEASKLFFLLFYLMYIYAIMEWDFTCFNSFQGNLSKFSGSLFGLCQAFPGPSCLSGLCRSRVGAFFGAIRLVEAAQARPEENSGTGIQKSPASDVCLPEVRPSTTTFWLLENYLIPPTCSLPLCKIRAALAGLLWRVSDRGTFSPTWHVVSALYPLGAVILEAGLRVVATSCFSREKHFALDTDSPFSAVRMPQSPWFWTQKWKMRALHLTGHEGLISPRVWSLPSQNPYSSFDQISD